MRGILFSLALAILLIWPMVAQGRMEFYTVTFTVVKEKLIPRLIDRLPRDERERLSDIELKLILDPTVVTATYTTKNPKTIRIFVGFMDGVFQYVDCMLLIKVNANKMICNDYFEYYFDHIVLRRKKPPLTVAQFVLAEDERVEAWYSDEEMFETRNKLFLAALIYVVMHELGHHIVGFSNARMNIAQHRELEARTDRWAINRLAQINENPILGAVIALGYLSQMERFRRIMGASTFSLHPKPRERALSAYEKACSSVSGVSALKTCEMLAEIIETFE